MPEKNEQPKQQSSKEYELMRADVPRYMKDRRIPQTKFSYWEAEADRILKAVGNRFEVFENGNDDLLKIGDWATAG